MVASVKPFSSQFFPLMKTFTKFGFEILMSACISRIMAVSMEQSLGEAPLNALAENNLDIQEISAIAWRFLTNI
jgi:hypothetical protein